MAGLVLILSLALSITVTTPVFAQDGPTITAPGVSKENKERLRDISKRLAKIAKKIAKPKGGPRGSGGDPMGPVVDLMLNSDKIALTALITQINKTIQRYHVDILSKRDLTAEEAERIQVLRQVQSELAEIANFAREETRLAEEERREAARRESPEVLAPDPAPETEDSPEAAPLVPICQSLCADALKARDLAKRKDQRLQKQLILSRASHSRAKVDRDLMAGLLAAEKSRLPGLVKLHRRISLKVGKAPDAAERDRLALRVGVLGKEIKQSELYITRLGGYLTEAEADLAAQTGQLAADIAGAAASAQALAAAEAAYQRCHSQCVDHVGLLTWETSEGTMWLPKTLGQPGSPSRIVARYSQDDGLVQGDLTGHTLKGQWIEGGSAEDCPIQILGRISWGRAELTFNADFTSFTGAWGYCGKDPDNVWTGKRVD